MNKSQQLTKMLEKVNRIPMCESPMPYRHGPKPPREVTPTDADKIVSVLQQSTSFVGAWGVPVTDMYVYTGRFEDVKNFLAESDWNVKDAVTLLRLIKALNKSVENSNKYALKCREDGFDGGTVKHYSSFKKGSFKGRTPDSVKEQDGVKIEFYRGLNPF